MTNEEALSLIREIQNVRPSKRYALDMAIEALEAKDRYRWHDLRKDPNDLPELGVEVLIFSSGKEFYVFWRHSSGWVDENGRTAVKPIAWRYIEPFTEE